MQENFPYIGIIYIYILDIGYRLYIHYSGALYSGVAAPSVERGVYVLL